MQKLKEYFTDGITSRTLQTVGAEIETQFLDKGGNPISINTSQEMLTLLTKRNWVVEGRKGALVTALVDSKGNKIFYELGRHNIEVATLASSLDQVLSTMQMCLDQLYEVAYEVGAEPYFFPVLPGDEDLLVIPDERDAVWILLDGRGALAPLARTSAVQFTVSVAQEEVVKILNALGENIDLFLLDYPQDVVWKEYIKHSSAGYLGDRYGGPLKFESLDDYCESLLRHHVVQGVDLVPFSNIPCVDIPLYLRSVWWYFRLKRYGNALCVEVRPLARSKDQCFQEQLGKVLSIVCL